MIAARSLRWAVFATCLAAAPACKSSDAGPTLAVQVEGDTRRMTVAELAALPGRDVSMDGHTYRGAPLARVLGGHEVKADESVVARGSDGYTQALAATAATRDDCIVAHQRDGQALPAAEGPLRIVLPGSPGLSVHNLVELRVEKRR